MPLSVTLSADRLTHLWKEKALLDFRMDGEFIADLRREWMAFRRVGLEARQAGKAR